MDAAVKHLMQHLSDSTKAMYFKPRWPPSQHLLSFPQELRDHILGYILKTTSIISLDSVPSQTRNATQCVRSHYRAVSATCRLLNHDAARMLYRQNTFEVWTPDGGCPWIPDHHFRLIRNFNINIFIHGEITEGTEEIVCAQIRGFNFTVGSNGHVHTIGQNAYGPTPVPENGASEKLGWALAWMVTPTLDKLRLSIELGEGIGIDKMRNVLGELSEMGRVEWRGLEGL